MGRRLLTLATAVSLAAAVVVCVQWFRGYRVQDQLILRRVVGTTAQPKEQSFGIVTCKGAFWFEARSDVGDSSYQQSIFADWRRRLGAGWQLRTPTYSNPHYPRFTTGWIHSFGFHASERNYVGTHMIDVVIPIWFALACTMSLPVAHLLLSGRRYVRTRRLLRASLCPTCGYDLRATPDRCPECGTVPAAPRNG